MKVKSLLPDRLLEDIPFKQTEILGDSSVNVVCESTVSSSAES